MKIITRTLAVLFLALASSSCVIVRSNSGVERTGEYVSPQTFANVKPGVSSDFVVAVLGDPTVKTAVDGGNEIWRWRYTEIRESNGGVFLLISSKRTTDTVHNCYVEFGEGKVVRAWRD